MNILILFRPGLTPIQKIGRQIMILQTIMVVSIVILFILHGLDTEEFEILFPIIAPVTSMYLSIAIKLFSKENDHFYDISNLPADKINKHLIKIRLLTLGLYLPTILLIALKSLFPNLLNFIELVVLLSLLQSFFGFNIGELLYKISELRIRHK